MVGYRGPGYWRERERERERDDDDDDDDDDDGNEALQTEKAEEQSGLRLGLSIWLSTFIFHFCHFKVNFVAHFLGTIKARIFRLQSLLFSCVWCIPCFQRI